jgi:hypothetical protein
MQQKKNTQTEVPKRMLGDSVFEFSDLDSAWSNYKNSPTFIQRKEQKV